MYVCIYAELGIYSSVYCVCMPQRAERRAVRKSDHYLGVDLKKESIGISTHPSKVPKTSDSLRDPTSSSGPGPEGQPDHAEIGPSGSWHVLVPRGCEYSGLDLFRCPFCLERRVTGQSPNFLKFGRAGDISDHRLRGIGNFDSWLSWLILALFLLLVQILEH